MSQGCFSFLERMPKMLDKILIDDVACEEEFVTEVAENDDIDEPSLRVSLDRWFAKTVNVFPSGRNIFRTTLTEREFENIVRHNVMSGTDVSYALLSKFTDFTDDQQLDCVLKVLRFLAACRLPKEFAGGFLILMVKHHILPA